MPTLQINPLHGKVLIQPEEHVPVESSTIIVPDALKGRDMPERGKVFAIGGRRVSRKGVVIEHEFRQGDRVFFPRFVGNWVEIRGQRFIQIDAKDVAAILG